MFPYQQFNPINPYRCTVVQQSSPFSREKGLNQSYGYSSFSKQQDPLEAELDFSDFASQDFINEIESLNGFFDHSLIEEVEQDESYAFQRQTLNRDFNVTKSISKMAKPQAQAPKKNSGKKEGQPEQDNLQNEHRNIPGALFGGLLKECKKPSSSFLDSQKNLAKRKIGKFLTQAEDYKRNQKTFNAIALFALGTEDEEVTSLALLIEFLKSEQHFFDFVRQSKMAQKRKEFLCEENSRGLYIKKFEFALQYVKDCLKKHKSEGLAVLIDKWKKNYKDILSNKIREQKTITPNNNY